GFIFCGTRRGVDLAAHYASADLLLFPSLTETFGNVVLEAMASGLAVVAYDYAAARLHLHNGRSGVRVAMHDAAGFIDAAAQLAAGPVRRQRLAAAARRQAEACGWEAVVGQLEAIYRELAP
nr:glycosyltransferase [Pseudomonadota bacterium]